MTMSWKFRALQLLPRPLRRRLAIARYEHEILRTGEVELTLLADFVPDDAIALDIGCNTGAYAYALSRIAPRVVAFEPNPALAAMVSSLALPKVEVRHVALSDRDGVAELLVPAGGHGLATLRPENVVGAQLQRIRVTTERLDALDLGRIGFIKIDVEGAEEMVLDGAMDTIARDSPVLLIEIEERHSAGALSRISARLAQLGYDARYYSQGAWRPLARFNAARDQAIDDDLDEIGKSVARRDHPYINNFLFEPARR